ncbi:MAG TPA: hypothetical protein VGO67_16525 [Verrucomicrobiae bacterium]|jgi:hypothetical protein
MRNAWKFFAGLVAGLFVALALHLIAFDLVLGVPTESSRWTFEVNRKKQMLARNSAPPRLLVVGGSASLFGISARELEKQTGMATLNLSTHAALGTDYILNTVESEAKAGDTVLLILEYELYTPNQKSDVWLDYLVARDPHYFHNLSLLDQWDVFMLTSEDRLIRGLKGWINPRRYAEHKAGGGAYNADYVDQWGDQTFHPRSAASAQIERRPSRLAFPMPARPAGLPLIQSFCQWAKEHQIRVLATYPNLLDQPELHTYPARGNAQYIANFYKEIGVPVVGDYTDALLPADQFFDTVYHLIDEAALARTDRLAEKLKPLLSAINGVVQPR